MLTHPAGYSIRTVVCMCFFNDTATTEIYTLSLHDALPISNYVHVDHTHTHYSVTTQSPHTHLRSEEHTSELQSHLNLVCRLLLEKNNQVGETQQISTVCAHATHRQPLSHTDAHSKPRQSTHQDDTHTGRAVSPHLSLSFKCSGPPAVHPFFPHAVLPI